MSELRKAKTDHAFFLTLTVVGWVDVFTRRDYRDIIIKNLKYCQSNEGLELYAFVIMSNHIHLVAKQNEGKLNELIGAFKSYTAKEILKAIWENKQESRKEWLIYLFKFFGKKSRQNKEYMFWEKTNYPTELFSNSVIDQKIEYIHNNPVSDGIVTDPESYVYSSACKNPVLAVLIT
jgi:putative transposase